MKIQRVSRSFFCLALLVSLAWPGLAEIPAPDHVLYGTALIDGILQTQGVVQVHRGDSTEALVTYEIGSIDAYGERFVIRLPMDALEPLRAGSMREGDEARIYFDRDPMDSEGPEIAGCALVGPPGRAQEVDIDPRFDEDPLVWVYESEGPPTLATSVTEGTTGETPIARVDVWLSRPVTYEIEVDWATADGTATGGADSSFDYRSASGTLIIPEGEVVAPEPIEIDIFGDELIEPSETFDVVLTAVRRRGSASPCTAASGVQIRDDGPHLDGVGTVEIIPDDRQWEIRVADAEVIEGDGGVPVEARFLISVERELPTGAPEAPEALLDVTFTTRDGSALAGEDYESASGSVTIDTSELCPESGTPCAWLPVTIYPDNDREPQESFFLDIAAPTPNPFGALVVDSEGEARIISDEVFLLFVEAELDGPDCPDCLLQGPLGAAVTPDGGQVYVAAGLDSAISSFNRDLHTGELEFLEAQIDEVGGVDGLSGVQSLVVAPGLCSLTPGPTCLRNSDCPTGETCRSRHVYGAGFLEDEISIFERSDNELDSDWGRLTFLEVSMPGSTELDGPVALALSPDGAHLYAAGKQGDTLVTLARDTDPLSPGFGLLTHRSTVHDSDPVPGGGQVNGLIEPRAVVVSPDGHHVYAASAVDSSVTMFERDSDPISPTFGDLSYLGEVRDATGGGPGGGPPVIDGLNGATALAFSPDGLFLYVAGELDDAVAVLARNADSASTDFGLLTWKMRRKEGIAGVSGLDRVAAVGVSADGGYVFATSREGNAVTVFEIDTDPSSSTHGYLDTFVEARRDGDPDPYGIPDVDPRLDGLAGGIGLALSPEPDGRHLYVVGNLDNGLAVFHKDLVAPDAPDFVLDINGATPSGHIPGVWTNNFDLEIAWRAQDDAFGVGLSGYPLLLDEQSATDPGTTLTQLHDAAVDPQTRSATLVDGTMHYFHVRACDRLDNCSEASHIGPFLIDTVQPSGPFDLSSPSHDPASTPVSDSDLDLSWTPATDAASGLAGYSLEVDALPPGNPAATCGTTLVLPPEATMATVASLPDGIWYGHLCARDVAGNWGAQIDGGPWVIDTKPPRVLGLDTVASTGDGQLADGEQTSVSVTQVVVTFDESDLLGGGETSSYRLIHEGLDGVIQSDTCDTLVNDDQLINLAEVLYASAAGVATLRLNDLQGHESLLATDFRLIICGDGALTDLAGNALDGDGDGLGGDDFLLDFEVQFANVLANPNLDTGLGEWQESNPGLFLHDVSEDADGAPTSGSAWLSEDFTPAMSYSLAQCVTVTEGEKMVIGATALIESSTAGEPGLQMIVDFYSLAECGGTSSGGVVTEILQGDTGGLWTNVSGDGIDVPAGKATALVQFVVVGDSAPGSQVRLDRLFFRITDLLFTDGFESGDSSAWNASVP